MTNKFLCLILGAMLMGCKESQPVVPQPQAPQSTELISRIFERLVSSDVAIPPTQTDTLHFVQLEDGYHAVNQGHDSRFTYDPLGRLIAQQLMGYRFSE